jgi:hypothetical protein
MFCELIEQVYHDTCKLLVGEKMKNLSHDQ